MLRGSYEEAETIGRELIEGAGHPAGYELKARAMWGMDEQGEAVELLEEAVAVEPDADTLWHWLGTFRSEIGRYDLAADAFEQAAACTDAVVSLELYNLAVVRQRQGSHTEAMEVLDRDACQGAEVPPAEYWHELRASALLGLGLWEETCEAADAGMAVIEAYGESEEPPADPDALHDLAGRMLFHKAQALLGAGKRDGREDEVKAEARALAVEAWRSCPPRGEPLGFIRRLDDLKTDTSAEWQLTVRCAPGERGREEGVEGYYLTAWAVADTVEEAVEFVRAMEPPFVGTVESLERHERLRDAPGEPKGMVAATGRTFFGGDDEDEA